MQSWGGGRRYGVDRYACNARGWNQAQQVDVIITCFVKQLIDESRGHGLLDVDYTNKEMVQRRKEQMSIIREHLNLIKQLKDVRSMLVDDQSYDDRQNLQTAQNVVLIDEAKELLSKKGVKAEF